MKVGDVVRIVQSDSCTALPAFEGEIGVIVAAQLGKFSDQDSFSVILRDKLHIFSIRYLELVYEGR